MPATSEFAGMAAGIPPELPLIAAAAVFVFDVDVAEVSSHGLAYHGPSVAGSAPMELIIIGRFHAREGQEAAVAAAMREVSIPTREEPGCLAIAGYRSIQDPRLFWVHSRWIDEAAFERRRARPHTV